MFFLQEPDPVPGAAALETGTKPKVFSGVAQRESKVKQRGHRRNKSSLLPLNLNMNTQAPSATFAEYSVTPSVLRKRSHDGASVLTANVVSETDKITQDIQDINLGSMEMLDQDPVHRYSKDVNGIPGSSLFSSVLLQDFAWNKCFLPFLP